MYNRTEFTTSMIPIQHADGTQCNRSCSSVSTCRCSSQTSALLLVVVNVDFLVGDEGIFTCKIFSTCSTLVRLFSSMGSLMPVEITTPYEAFFHMWHSGKAFIQYGFSDG